MDRTLGLGYAQGSLLIILLLTSVFVLWRFTAGSLSIKDIKSTKEEIFYWTAILLSNTLGTALGDFLADDSGLGFGGGALLIALLLLAVTGTYFFTKASRTAVFWIAFVLTRPFGATLGDLLTKSYAQGGLGFGTIGSSIVLGLTLLFLIIYTRWQLRHST